jgi:hypothetical protein
MENRGSTVIPGRAERESQMRNCASGNLEIPGSPLCAAPRNDVGNKSPRPGMTGAATPSYRIASRTLWA